MFGAPRWEKARDLKQARRNALLDNGRALLTDTSLSSDLTPELEKDIVRANAPEIVENISSSRKGWTATNVLLTYIRRATAVHDKSNCLTEILFERALETARALDEEFERTGKVKGRLHGVPISLKDQIGFEGVDSTIGCSGDINKPSTEHSTLVKIILAEGGVPFVKTAVPQTMLSFECSTPLWGKTTNPYSAARIPGGSSGGEGCLLGSDGSPLGFGSDIGGSLRIPAGFSGCYGLKPCSGRFPSTGCVNPNPGFEAVKSTMGPMGRSVQDLELAMRVFADASEQWARTESLIPMKYQDVKLPKKLKFGYYLTDGICRSSPACERAVLETVAALRKEGHEVVEFVPPNPTVALESFVSMTSAEGYKTLLRNGAKGDPLEPALFLTTLGVRLPSLVRKFLAWVMGTVVGDATAARILRASRPKTVSELQKAQADRSQYVHDFKAEVWGNLKLDGIICQVLAVPALKLGETADLSVLAAGTFLYNVVDSSAIVVPVTFVDPAKDAITPEWRARGIAGSKVLEAKVYGTVKNVKAAYNADEMAGLPVGVQIIGATWEDEKVIEMAKIVDRALGPRGFGPGEFVKRFD